MNNKDLKIRGMKLAIAIKCKETYESDAFCTDCDIGGVCPRGLGVPRKELCKDWDEEITVRAYKLLNL